MENHQFYYELDETSNEWKILDSKRGLRNLPFTLGLTAT
jgi:hypothetical protein